MSEHQKVQKISQKMQSNQDKIRKKRKESTAAHEEMRKIREEIDRNEERKQVDCSYGTRPGEV